ncbi:insulin-like growth factor 2 mRNA-binding protein 2 isoform X2, partial [Arapaima gigas]
YLYITCIYIYIYTHTRRSGFACCLTLLL